MADPLSEFELIEWLRLRTAAHPAVALGIGDDAALVRIPPPGECLVTVDMLMEGIDFSADADRRAVGRKSLAAGLSDIAAMGGLPLAAFPALALPKNNGRAVAESVYAGIEPLAREFGVAIAGGDTNSWDGPLVLSVTVLGRPIGAAPVRRNGARAGDWIVVTGEFGGSLLGKHLTFQPRVREAVALRGAAALHAMIDVSDGLAADLHHILRASSVGAILRAADVPISAAAHKMAGDRTPLEHALGDGEDFELLFTVSAADGRRLLASPPTEVRLSHIGEIVAERKCEIVDESGRRSPLPPLGWVHSI